MTPVEHDDTIFGVHVVWDIHGSAIDEIDCQRGKQITRVKFFSHDFVCLNDLSGRESTDAKVILALLGRILQGAYIRYHTAVAVIVIRP